MKGKSTAPERETENAIKLLRNPSQKDKIKALSKLNAFADDNLNVVIFDRVVKLWEKEKMPITGSIFSFSNNVFKRLLSH